MKTYFRTIPLKFIIKKRVLLINSIFFTVLISFLALSCIKEDYPVRLVFPVLTTVAASDITASSAVTGGNVSSEGSKAVTARGVCWSVSGNPSIQYVDSITVDGAGPGQYASTIEGLLANKTYHVRAYATNPEGTSYGQDLSFKTAAP